MGIVVRGFKNAFRNLTRTVGVILILALSTGLALIMLLSYQTVQNRIEAVKSSVGNTITINPAGAQGFQGGGEPLTEDQANTVKGLPHVASINTTLQDRLTPTTDTTLASAIDPGTLGNRAGRQQQRQFGGRFGGNQNFTIPINVTGVSDTSTISSGNSKITAGNVFSSDSTEVVAVVGTDLATKNNLSVGSTFTAYGKSISVVGIYDAGNQFANSGIYMPIATLQTLSGQAGQLNSITATVDNADNMDSTVSAVKNALGTDKVDVTSSADITNRTIEPLQNIKNISFYGLVGALVAGGVIIFLIMMMIVRERRREIGVLKAIGSSNVGVIGQFISESFVLTFLGSVVGIVVGAIFSNPVLNTLVSKSAPTVQAVAGGGRGGGGLAGGGFGRFAQISGQLGGNVQNTVRNLHAAVGINIILYGLLAAIIVAVIGSAIPAWLISKVKPAEVMRAE